MGFACNPCPRCGCDVAFWPIRPAPAQLQSVTCHQCRHTGPPARTLEEGVAGWNQTKGPPNGAVQAEMRFDGSDYDASADNERLAPQYARIFRLMSDGRARTLEEISKETGAPTASVSAQLRHMRKKRFGEHVVEKAPRGNRDHGLYEYTLHVNPETWATEESETESTGGPR